MSKLIVQAIYRELSSLCCGGPVQAEVALRSRKKQLMAKVEDTATDLMGNSGFYHHATL